MENLEIYNKYRVVPENALKAFNNGKFSGTDINTMWRIKSLTEIFGVCGFGWYYDIVRTWYEEAPNDEKLAFAEIKLYVKLDNEWSKGISAVGGSKIVNYFKTAGYATGNDEGFKMAITDALGVACKMLGFGADIYWANDKTKYSNNENPIVKPKAKTEIKNGKDFVLTSGKYPNNTLQQIFEKDKQYLTDLVASGKLGLALQNNIEKCFIENGEIIEIKV